MKIIHVLSSLNIGSGISSVVVNYLQNLHSDEIQCEILCFYKAKESYEEFLNNLGIKVHFFNKPKISNYIKVKRNLKRFFFENNYDIIHCHDVPVSSLILSCKKSTKSKFIIHAHNTKFSNSFIKSLRNRFIYKGVNKKSDLRIACGNLAGNFQFKNYKFTILTNAINESKFKFDPLIRENLKTKYGLNNNIVLGTVGRLSYQKNQIFLLQVLKKLLELNNKYILVLVGDGENRNMLENEVKMLDLAHNVKFIGNVTNVNEFYNCFDLFLLPSLFEGLPVVALEAQFNSLKFITSTHVTTEIKIKDDCSFLDLDVDQWVSFIQNSDLNRLNNFTNAADNFKLMNSVYKLKRIYQDLL